MTDHRRQPPWPTDEDAVPLPPGYPWSPQERWAWARILRGMIADLSDYAGPREVFPDHATWLAGKDDGAGYDANQEADGALTVWPEHRTLSDAFLRLILFQSPWAEAPVEPRVRISSAVLGELNWDGQTYPGELWLIRCRFSGEACWRALRIAGSLVLNSSRMEKIMRADRLQTGGSVFCRAGFHALEEVRLLGAKIGSNGEMDAARLDKGVDADGIEIGGDLFLRNGAVIGGPCRFVGAKIAGNLELDGSTLTAGLDVDTSVIGGNIYCRSGFDVTGEVNLLGTRIDGNVHIWGGQFRGLVDMTGTRIRGDFVTSYASSPGPVWHGDARLVLRNARIGALAGGPDSFPSAPRGKPPPMDLTGLTYERLGGLGAQDGGSLATASVSALKKWLTAGHKPREYTPGPYRTLANALVEAGEARKANHVLYFMRRQEHACETNALSNMGYFFSDLFIGYGHRSWRGIMWFLALVFGFAAYGLWLEGTPGDPTLEPGPENLFRWLGFSLGNAIPLIVLDKAHETFLAAVLTRTNEPMDVPVHVAWAFYGQKILGFIILSYLAAGLSGLATRQRD